MATIAERVQAGMAFLDVEAPGWEQRIDLDKLDLSSCGVCVVGQVVGAKAELGLISLIGGDRVEREFKRDWWPPELGFNKTETAWSWENLTRAWKRAIRARLARATGGEGAADA